MTTNEEKLMELGKFTLREIKECVSECGFEVDTATLADFCVSLGLIQYVPYDPAKHTTVFQPDCEEGDMIFYWGAK